MCRSEGNKAVDIKKKKKERNIRDAGLNLGQEELPGIRNGNELQCSCLETPMDRGAQRTTFHRVAKWGTTEACFYC